MGQALIDSLLAALVAFLVSSAAIPLVKRLALAVRAVDYPGGRRDQAGGIPRLGGVAAVLGLFVAQGLLVVLRWGEFKGGISNLEAVTLPLAFFIIFICGLLEDTLGLSPISRVLMQATAALLVIRAGWSFGAIYLPFVGDLKLGALTGLISLLWIVGVTNAINLLDGLDGLAGGVVAIIASTMLIFSLWHQDYLTVLVMGAMVGACMGFLRKNWAPAKIYLGDAGSLTLGFLLAIVSVRSSVKVSAAIAILVPILALGLPVIDTLLVMLFRFTQKRHSPLARRFARMFRADRNHLHHLMTGLGRSRGRIVLGIYAVALVFCAMALVAATSRNATLGFALVGVEILVVFGMRQLGLHADALKISLEKRKAARELLHAATETDLEGVKNNA
ncbi:MAG: MraY family glycosyltransferase [Acidobacteriota bacterium]|jgi:UDP-GlcNAc:undecaprenyl-phosphate GlcNAc-1-phosphate transferase